MSEPELKEPEPEPEPEEPDDEIERPPPKVPVVEQEEPEPLDATGWDIHDGEAKPAPAARAPRAVQGSSPSRRRAGKKKPPKLITRVKCKHPPEAKAQGITTASVTLLVSVTDQGTVASVRVVSDPGDRAFSVRQRRLGSRLRSRDA